MTSEEISKAVADGIRDALADPRFHCRYSSPPEQHAKEHEAVQRFIKLMDGINSIQWAVARAVAIALIMGIVGLLGYGLMHKILAALGGITLR